MLFPEFASHLPDSGQFLRLERHQQMPWGQIFILDSAAKPPIFGEMGRFQQARESPSNLPGEIVEKCYFPFWVSVHRVHLVCLVHMVGNVETVSSVKSVDLAISLIWLTLLAGDA